MQTYQVNALRIDLPCRKPYVEVVAMLEKLAPVADIAAFDRMARSRATAAEIEDAVKHMVDDLEFLVLGKLDQGSVTSLLGRPKKLSVYLIGNPVLANRMFEVDPAVGLYAPIRALVYEDYNGTCHFTYDRPSGLLEQFGQEKIRAVARMLDEKMDSLARQLSQ